MVVHLGLQVREERLRDRVIPADPDLAHGLADVVAGTPFLEVTGGVLRTPV
ncbi:hypothetical protein ART_3404 [Arthrobacter sp. PAMC 25486]|nr:hypothetical protein ART_3404 [Arthrobacter sp. PAMC 25486]